MNSQPASKAQLWGGYVVSALPVLGLGMSAAMKLSKSPEMLAQLTGKFGYPASIITPLAIVELVSAVLYAIPKTSVLGAVLATGYLGGAIATHVRVADPFIAPLVFGVLIWGGLFLRDVRVRALLPLRK